MEYYRDSDIEDVLSQMRASAEQQFFKEGEMPGNESSMLKGYGMAIDGFVGRLKIISEQRRLRTI